MEHGRVDNVVEVEQSKRLVAELKAHGVTYEARFDKNEGHGTAYFKNRVELYGAIEAFLAKYLGPGLAAPAS